MDDSQNNDKKIEIKPNAGDVTGLMLFNRNSHFAFIFKKTEKLVTAVYMITNFVKDNEPLKWQIRENCLELMGLNISFNTVSLSERKDLMRQFQAISLEIVSLTGVAYHSGLISEMNFHVLSREFGALLSLVEKDENKKSNEETVILDPGFFNVGPEKRNDPTGREAALPSVTPREDVLYKSSMRSSVPGIDFSRTGERPDKKIEYLPIKDTRERSEKPTEGKEDRKSIILKLLAKKSGLSIKDFALGIKGCSEKTIQRELLAMVAQGVLKKEGERRWSKYSLA